MLRQRWSCTFWREWTLLVRVRRERVRAPPGQLRGGGPRQEATQLDWSDMLFEPNADAGYGRGGGLSGFVARRAVHAAVAVARRASLLRCTATFAGPVEVRRVVSGLRWRLVSLCVSRNSESS